MQQTSWDLRGVLRGLSAIAGAGILGASAGYGNEGGRSRATTRAAHDNCKSRWWQAQFVEPRRPGPGDTVRSRAAVGDSGFPIQ
jgi:hypothetical protein